MCRKFARSRDSQAGINDVMRIDKIVATGRVLMVIDKVIRGVKVFS